MNKLLRILILVFVGLASISCQTVSNKIDEKTSQEEKELTKWLNKTAEDLKISFGKPDQVDFAQNGNRYYVYIKEKIKIKCERKFEINPKNIVVGFISKNCF